jgi:hypothetical protein
LVAVAVNTIVLKAAWLLGIEAESGGLFRLLRLNFGGAFAAWGVGRVWGAAHLPAPGTAGFWLLFHAFMGLVMAFLYAVAVEPLLPGPGWKKGVVYAMVVWLINSAVVMPLLGKGFAASHALTPRGMAYFFVANGVYGVLLGLLYERFAIQAENGK